MMPYPGQMRQHAPIASCCMDVLHDALVSVGTCYQHVLIESRVMCHQAHILGLTQDHRCVSKCSLIKMPLCQGRVSTCSHRIGWMCVNHGYMCPYQQCQLFLVFVVLRAGC